MTNSERDSKYDVIWSGEEGLIEDRPSKPDPTWTPPKRAYTFSGKYIGLFKPSKKQPKVEIDNPEVELKIDTFGEGN